MVSLLKFLKNHKRESIFAPLFKMLEAFFDLLVPLIMADIINVGIAQKDTRYIINRCILMVLLGVVGLACSITAQYFAAKAAVESGAEIRKSLFGKIQTLGFSQTDSVGTSTLITRMTSDVNQVQSGLNLFLRLFLRSPFVVLGALVLAFTINAKEAYVFAVTVPILAVIIFGIMLKTIPMYKNVQSRLDRLTGLTRENLTGVRVVRAFGRENDETNSFREANSSLTHSQLGVGGISALMNPLTFVVINLAIVAILNAGAFDVNSGVIAAGDVVALVNYMTQVLIELVKLANLIIQMTKAVACTQRINDVLSLKEGMTYGSDRVEVSDDVAVQFDNVSLAYNSDAEKSLDGISFSAEKGQTIGIIGGTGSGKTSLVSLIPRFYDATEGSVLLFGKDVKSYDRDSLRKTVSTVMQKAQLFSGTIRENLLWGNESATDDELWQALETAQATEVVKGKSGGLDEEVEQGGRNFSGGQKQRLSIARSVVSGAKILILDDSSSALDYATDAALRKALKKLPADMTVFIVSQRTGSIAHADKIIVLDEGKAVGIGTHEQLLESCQVYRDIYESQFSKSDKNKSEGGKAE